MKSNPLKLVDNQQPAVDIYAALKARIASRDWAQVHIRGDKAQAITLPMNWRAPR